MDSAATASAQGVVVTGAARGIGAAIARRMHGDGARLVLADLDGEALARVADELGALAVAGDAASEDGVNRLVRAATDHLGRIDAFFANAGVAVGGGPETPESEWQLAWEVNVMAHVRAARALLPGWLDAGGGRFVVTASAAGLLTMLGSAPYSVTKHAAVAHAEWLSATYGDRGVVVQCLCPQGVRTKMLDDTGVVGSVLLAPEAITAEQVADVVAEALQDNRFLILPHPEVADYYADRARDPDRWLSGMRRLQGRLQGSLQADAQTESSHP